MAEDADRSWGWSASPCVAPPVGAGRPHAQSCNGINESESKVMLHVHATHKDAEHWSAAARGDSASDDLDDPCSSNVDRDAFALIGRAVAYLHDTVSQAAPDRHDGGNAD